MRTIIVATLGLPLLLLLLLHPAQGQTTGMVTTAAQVTTHEATHPVQTTGQQQISTTQTPTTTSSASSSGIPSQFNWATGGTFGNSSSTCSPPVLNQGQCGSCYSFSTALTVGTSMCAARNAPAFLNASPQYVLDLNYNTNNVDPCDGGVPASMISLVASSGSLSTCQTGCSAGCLPYNAVDCLEMSSGTPDWQQECAQEQGCTCNSFTQVACNSGFTAQTLPSGMSSVAVAPDLVQASSITAIQTWLMTNGPVSIAMDACDTFQNWWSSNPGASVFTGGCTSTVNHAVTIVGWAQVSGGPAWIIQNSWGTSGGDSGFFYVAFTGIGTGASQTNIQTPYGLSVSGATSSSSSSSSGSGNVGSSNSGPHWGLGAAPTGHRQPLNINSDRVRDLASHYINTLRTRTGRSDYTLLRVHRATAQVTNTTVYRIDMTVRGDSDELHNVTMLPRRQPLGGAASSQQGYDVVQYKVAAASTSSASSSSSSSSSSSDSSKVGLGVGVSIGAAVCVALIAAVVVMKLRAPVVSQAGSSSSSSNKLEEPLLEVTEA